MSCVSNSLNSTSEILQIFKKKYFKNKNVQIKTAAFVLTPLTRIGMKIFGHPVVEAGFTGIPFIPHLVNYFKTILVSIIFTFGHFWSKF